MSDWHALDGSAKKEYIRVVFHIPIPDINNAVGASYRTAISKAEPYISSEVPDLETNFATEHAELQSAAKYEYSEIVYYNGNLNDAQKLAVIDARYTTLVGIILARLQNEYVYWGKYHDVS